MAYEHNESDLKLARRIERANLRTWRLRRIVDAIVKLQEAVDLAASKDAFDAAHDFSGEEAKLYREIDRRDKLHAPEKPKVRVQSRLTSIDEAVLAARQSAGRLFDHKKK